MHVRHALNVADNNRPKLCTGRLRRTAGTKQCLCEEAKTARRASGRSQGDGMFDGGEAVYFLGVWILTVPFLGDGGFCAALRVSMGLEESDRDDRDRCS